MATDEQRAFLEKNRLVIIGFNRKKGPPHMTPVYYALDGDDLLIYGKGVIEDEGAVDVMMRVGERMTGQPIAESARPALEDRARNEGRVVLRVTPESFHPR